MQELPPNPDNLYNVRFLSPLMSDNIGLIPCFTFLSQGFSLGEQGSTMSKQRTSTPKQKTHNLSTQLPEHLWKSGESGNPDGRPPNMMTLIRKEMEQINPKTGNTNQYDTIVGFVKRVREQDPKAQQEWFARCWPVSKDPLITIAISEQYQDLLAKIVINSDSHALPTYDLEEE